MTTVRREEPPEPQARWCRAVQVFDVAARKVVSEPAAIPAREPTALASTPDGQMGLVVCPVSSYVFGLDIATDRCSPVPTPSPTGSVVIAIAEPPEQFDMTRVPLQLAARTAPPAEACPRVRQPPIRKHSRTRMPPTSPASQRCCACTPGDVSTRRSARTAGQVANGDRQVERAAASGDVARARVTKA